jgi:tRNA-splicing ligase RtcB
VLAEGSGALLERGLATMDDLAHTEAGGALPGADPDAVSDRAKQRGHDQLGTLGSGNHFIELAADEDGRIWILLHSGSRGGGNRLATMHTEIARKLHEGLGTRLEDPELAWLQEGTPEFDAYIRDLRWSQGFARENRRQMLEATHRALETVLAREVATTDEVNCHHNFTERERHGGRDVWVTRKGAIRARVGDRGLIPGAMGQRSYVIRGRGNATSYESCAHGAGRRMSRRQARKQLSVESFSEAMGAASWQRASARALLDEHPSAYKPIDVVMRDQADLVEIEHELNGIANFKGVEIRRRR